MRILLDCDGVICNFVDKILEFDNHEHTYESITDFNIFKAWGQVERWKDFTQWISVPGRVLDMKPFDGAVEFVNELRKFGEVAIATSPFKSPNWIPERLEWLEINFGFKADDVCVWSKKHWISADLLIDDSLDNALNFPGNVFLLEAPWNQASTLPPNVKRVFSFGDIIDRVEKLKIKYDNNELQNQKIYEANRARQFYSE